ncbi:MAG TPA: YetF domain-containing protein [Moraxellaceae bacterium]
MLDMSVPWWEFILRAVVVYLFLLVLLRLTGKRQIGELSPFDLVLLLILSNAVQNSMNAGDNSLIGGLISATVLILLNYGIGQLTFRSRKLEGLIEGRPQLLIHNGQVYQDVLARNQLTQQELETALRQNGCTEVEEVKLAVLEDNGHISVIPRSKDD